MIDGGGILDGGIIDATDVVDGGIAVAALTPLDADKRDACNA